MFHQYPDDDEHPDAWLGHGYDDGPLYVLAFTAGRVARFDEYADQDSTERLAPEPEARDVTDEEAMALWKQLASGDVEAVRAWRWTVAGT